MRGVGVTMPVIPDGIEYLAADIEAANRRRDKYLRDRLSEFMQKHVDDPTEHESRPSRAYYIGVGEGVVEPESVEPVRLRTEDGSVFRGVLMTFKERE